MSNLVFKVIVIGDSFVGKTNIIQRFTSNVFSDQAPTVGVKFHTKVLTLHHNDKDVEVTFQLWDTQGQEKYRAMTKQYYRGAHGVLIIYDITNMQSFQNVETWAEDFQNGQFGRVPIILVGNKKDLESQRQVQSEEGTNLS